jgi:hypothetical protein
MLHTVVDLLACLAETSSSMRARTRSLSRGCQPSLRRAPFPTSCAPDRAVALVRATLGQDT